VDEWEEDLERGFLKITEGDHELIVRKAPVNRKNNYGKDQWLFEDASLDGVDGMVTPPKGLLRLLKKEAEQRRNAGKNTYPIVVEFTRVGMDVKSVFKAQSTMEEIDG